MADLTLTDFKAATDLANEMQSTDPGDAVGVGMKGYPVVGDTKTINGQTATWDGQVWMYPTGKPAW